MVEVTLALGLAGFCLIALLGLLPLGLDSMGAAGSEAGATNCMEQIAEAVRGAVVSSSSTAVYEVVGAYKNQNLTWALGGGQVDRSLGGVLSPSGFPSTNGNEARFVAHVKIFPPASVNSTGTAVISVAWPARSAWNAAAQDWQNARGAVHSVVVFLPNP